MGISNKAIKCIGVRYDLDAFNDKVRTGSLEELLKIYKEVMSTDVLPDWCEGDIISAFDEEVFDESGMELTQYGNSICDTKNNPFGIILTTNTTDSVEYLNYILTKIGSSRKIGEHCEISIS